MDAAPIPPSIPFHVARAYGIGAPAPSRPARAPDAPIPNAASRVARVADHVDLSQRSLLADAMRERTRALIAARVERGIDFVTTGIPAAPGAISMYRHPADKNAAATGVDAGRMLDVQG